MLREKVYNLKRIDNAKESNLLVREIIENPTDEIKIQLLEEFKEYVNWCKIGEFPDNQIYGIQCLVLFKELHMKEAFDLVAEYLQLDFDLVESEIDDSLLEIVYEIICALGDNRVEDIKKIIKDEKVNVYIRAVFSSAFSLMTYMGKADKEDTRKFYEEFFMNKKESLQIKFLASFDVENMGMTEFKDLVKEVVIQYEKIAPEEYNEPQFDSKKYEKLLNSKSPLVDYLNFYEIFDSSGINEWDDEEDEAGEFFNDILMELNEFSGFDDLYDVGYQEPRTSVKIGRNDPCPCGSGKKYKKCCGK